MVLMAATSDLNKGGRSGDGERSEQIGEIDWDKRGGSRRRERGLPGFRLERPDGSRQGALAEDQS